MLGQINFGPAQAESSIESIKIRDLSPRSPTSWASAGYSGVPSKAAPR
jgi:hypothetical protein